MNVDWDKKMGYASIIHVSITQDDDGLFVASSPDLAGFLVAHPDKNEVVNDIPNVIRMLIRRRTNQDVVVAPVSPKRDELPAWVSIPSFVATRELEVAI